MMKFLTRYPILPSTKSGVIPGTIQRTLNGPEDTTMSLPDAIRTMNTIFTVSVESDVALANDISARQAELVAQNTKLARKRIVSPAIGIHGDLKLRPITAMLELARGTVLNHDPEIAAFARQWSTLRYLGIFAGNAQNNKLSLDAEAFKYLGPNQRRILSEDFGIGFGIIVAKRWCEARTSAIGPVTAIDIDKAIYDRKLPEQPPGGRQPDYLLTYVDPANSKAMVYELLETKGTISRSFAKKQLSRAVTQLAGLIVDGKPLTGIAVSTVSNEHGLNIMAVDPEEARVTWEPTNEILQRSRTVNKRQRKKDDSPLDLVSEEFLASATNVNYASLAEFSGQHGAARRWMPQAETGRGIEVDSEIRHETGFGRFVGTEDIIQIPGASGRLRLFQGVEEHVAEGLKSLDVTAVLSAQRAFADGLIRETDLSSAVTENAEVASAVTSDGSMIEISIV